MDTEDILNAAESIKLYEKIVKFRNEVPNFPTTVTITLKNSSRSRSVSFNDTIMIQKIFEAFEDIQLDIKDNLERRDIHFGE